MAVRYADKYDTFASLMASYGVGAFRATYTVTETEAVGDVILMRRLPAGMRLFAIISETGASTIDGELVLASEDGTILEVIGGPGLNGTLQVDSPIMVDCYLAINVGTAPGLGDAGNIIKMTGLYVFGGL